MWQIWDHRYKDDVVFSRYAGFVDNIHRVSIFPELYAALRASANYYSFLDTDEFLAWLEHDLTVIRDHRVVERIANSGLPVLPGTWLSNVIGFGDRFFVDVGGRGLGEGFEVGKAGYSFVGRSIWLYKPQRSIGPIRLRGQDTN